MAVERALPRDASVAATSISASPVVTCTTMATDAEKMVNVIFEVSTLLKKIFLADQTLIMTHFYYSTYLLRYVAN